MDELDLRPWPDAADLISGAIRFVTDAGAFGVMTPDGTFIADESGDARYVGPEQTEFEDASVEVLLKSGPLLPRRLFDAALDAIQPPVGAQSRRVFAPFCKRFPLAYEARSQGRELVDFGPEGMTLLAGGSFIRPVPLVMGILDVKEGKLAERAQALVDALLGDKELGRYVAASFLSEEARKAICDEPPAGLDDAGEPDESEDEDEHDLP
jgi:hypothetical protein